MWITVLGAGLGLALPTAGNAALGALSPERSGVGTGLMMAVRTVGSTFGVAILGSVLNSAYQSRLHLAGLPAAGAGAVRKSVFAGIAMAGKLGSPSLLASVKSAFVHGMDVMLWACGGLAVIGAALALFFLPWRVTTAAPSTAAPEATGEGSGHERAA